MDIDLSQREFEVILAWYMNTQRTQCLPGSYDLMRRLRAGFDQAVREAQQARSMPVRPRRGMSSLVDYRNAMEVYEREMAVWREHVEDDEGEADNIDGDSQDETPDERPAQELHLTQEELELLLEKTTVASVHDGVEARRLHALHQKILAGYYRLTEGMASGEIPVPGIEVVRHGRTPAPRNLAEDTATILGVYLADLSADTPQQVPSRKAPKNKPKAPPEPYKPPARRMNLKRRKGTDKV